jgi:hypothetical protein
MKPYYFIAVAAERTQNMHIVPRFSFKYRGKPFDLSMAKVTPTDYGYLYELADGLCVELHVK